MRTGMRGLYGLILLLAFAGPALGQAGLRRVDAAATGANDGTSWADAYTELYLALADTEATEIWVAEGAYYPEPVPPGNDSRIATFLITGTIQVYGGFVGNETDRSERNPEQNLTILSGDLDQDDGDLSEFPNYPSLYDDNAYHVVSFAPTFEGTPIRFSGFVIRSGYADGQEIGQDQ